MNALSPKARLVLAFVQQFQADRNCPPTMREIGSGCRIKSTRSVSDYLKELEAAGRIRRREGRSRGIELVVADGPPKAGIPVLGRIAAGTPLAADAVYDGQLPVDGAALFGTTDCFALEVVGDSMIDRNIVEGDLAILRAQSTAHSGEVVAVSVEDEVTLKVFRPEGKQVLLMPANSAYAPIVLNEDSGIIRILGVMVGLVRSAHVWDPV